MSNDFELSDDDVISAESSPGFSCHRISTVRELRVCFNAWVKEMEAKGRVEAQWFKENGFECQTLCTHGGGWQKGRLRFRMEFIPDDQEYFKNCFPVDDKSTSPLDDLRTNLDI